MLLGRGPSSKSSRMFWLDSTTKNANKPFSFLLTIQASSSLLLRSALAAAERKTKTKNQEILVSLCLYYRDSFYFLRVWNSYDKYFKFARAIVSKLLVWMKNLRELNEGRNSSQIPGYLYSNSTALKRRQFPRHNSGYSAILYWYHFYNFCWLAS